jgi:dTMP kinase
MLVVLEGLDGAGKRTLTDTVLAELRRRGARAAGLAFPRYGRSAAADLVRDALYRRAGDLGDSVYGMASLYALDRAGAAGELREACAANDVVLVDRFVASNAAYGAARLRQGADGEFVGWVRGLELDRLGLPVPDLHLLLRVPAGVAAGRAAGRADTDAGRARDAFESDAGLQERTAAVYEQLAAVGWLGPWRVLDGVAGVDVPALVSTLLVGGGSGRG